MDTLLAPAWMGPSTCSRRTGWAAMSGAILCPVDEIHRIRTGDRDTAAVTPVAEGKPA